MRSSKISAEPGPGGAPRLSAYLDTNVLIRMMERTDARADEAARLLALAEGGKLTLATSELTLSELLNQGKSHLEAPWLGLSGFIVIAAMLSLLIFVGEAVRDAFDPRRGV